MEQKSPLIKVILCNLDRSKMSLNWIERNLGFQRLTDIPASYIYHCFNIRDYFMLLNNEEIVCRP